MTDEQMTETVYPTVADQVAALRAELAEALALLADAPDHAAVDAAVFENNVLRQQNDRLREALRELLKAFPPETAARIQIQLWEEQALPAERESLYNYIRAARQAAALLEGKAE